MFINGKWTTGHSSESFVRKSPAHDIVVSTYPAGTVEDVDEAVKAERERMIALDALNDGSEAVKKIVDHAKSEGKTADEISFYVDTIKEAKPKDAETSNYVDQAIQDFANSGADGVKPVPHEAENKKSEDKECEEISNAFGVVMKGEK